MAQRDAAFLGLHAGCGERLEDLDVYGTLREKRWSADLDHLLSLLRASHRALLAACPADELPRMRGLSPVNWSIGHVAFTFDSIIAYPLLLSLDGHLDPHHARAEAWQIYDSMRVSHEERWRLSELGELPDRASVTRYLEMVHEMAAAAATATTAAATTAAATTATATANTAAAAATAAATAATAAAATAAATAQGGLKRSVSSIVPPVLSYLILYAAIHELWHAEDLSSHLLIHYLSK